MNSSQEVVDAHLYLTMEALEDGLSVSFPYICSYCIDFGLWLPLAANTSTPSINRYHTISFKATNITPTSGAGIGTFTVNKKFNLWGNCMSMLLGDYFSSKTSLEGYDYAFKFLFRETPVVNVSASFLPATTLSIDCYRGMFYECPNLRNTPLLPATNLADSCYRGMFFTCTSLRTVTELPATTLADNCYWSMYQNCSSLETAQEELPATTLTTSCYSSMYNGCSSLKKSPILPALSLASSCYTYMFQNCSSLSQITALFTTTPSTSYTTKWVDGVASTGIFYKNPNSTWNVTGVNGVPSGWVMRDFGEKYFTIECLTALSFYLPQQVLEYSLDGGFTWSTLDDDWSPTFPNGSYVKLRAQASISSSNGIGTFAFSINSRCRLSGNCMSLIYGDEANNHDSVGDYCFYALFSNAGEVITSVSEDFLPATTLGYRSYAYMFFACTGLTSAPNLPATGSGLNYAASCYSYMFYGCTNLTRPPEYVGSQTRACSYMFCGCTSLTTTPTFDSTPASYAYSHMFENCISLTEASSNIWNAYGENACEYMFKGCTSLVEAPILYSQTLTEGCYKGMFWGCSSLNYIEMYALDITAEGCLDNWVQGVSSSGTFVKDRQATWNVTGVNGVPSGWTVEKN